MICPRCGNLNHDTSSQCSHCYHQFDSVYGVRAPGAKPFFNSGKSAKAKRAQRFLALLFLGLLGLMIASWIVSLFR